MEGKKKKNDGGAIKTRARINNTGLTSIDLNLHSNGFKINDVTRIFMIGFPQAALIIFNFHHPSLR